MNNSNRLFLLQNLILKDFKIRYRNMSLGIAWSVANPLVMMAILTFVFTRIYPNASVHNFAVFVLCALVPFNFYSLALNAGTTSLLENDSLIKRVQCPREVFPIAAVLANCLHFLIQIGLLLAFVLILGYSVNRY
jgi:ABC-type polysaccharide/polyol phosphate export permease